MNKYNNCTIYIVRHGQTDWNLNGLTQGEEDIPLNATGIEQAQALRKELDGIKFDVVFSSDLIRAKRTAEIITLEQKLEIETTKLLQERRYGKLNGQPYEKLKKFNEIWATLSKKERATYKPYDGYETDDEAVSRFITYLREIAVVQPGKIILVVSHGGIMRAFLNHISDKTYLGGAISNLAYVKIESDGVDFFIKEKQGIKEPEKEI